MPAEALRPVTPRKRDDAAAMAVAIQANLVALKVAWSRRANIASDAHSIQVQPPGAVQRFREVLIDRQVIAEYSDEELVLRTRQVWGEFSVMCWAFQAPDPQHPPEFAPLPAMLAMRSIKEMLKKEAQVVQTLWRLRHEQRLRFDPDAKKDPAFQRDHEAAQGIVARVYETDIRLCSNEDLVACACEHAGMLGAIRWLIDDGRTWGEPGIMEIAS
jgi:hypothetical protein